MITSIRLVKVAAVILALSGMQAACTMPMPMLMPVPAVNSASNAPPALPSDVQALLAAHTACRTTQQQVAEYQRYVYERYANLTGNNKANNANAEHALAHDPVYQGMLTQSERQCQDLPKRFRTLRTLYADDVNVVRALDAQADFD